MCRVIAVSNQKGGVGKTVSCVNLGIGLAQEGKKVLMIDADPQGSLTISLGYEEPDEMEYSLATLMMNIVNDEKLNIEKTILHHKEGVDLIPANIELSAIEVSLVNAMSRELILRSMVDRLREFYDYIIIDCMPSLGMMTINALACADSVLIPVQAAYLPVKGLQQAAVMGMMVIMMPFFFLAMYEKNGQPLEVILNHMIQAVFKRPKIRPYKTDNYYAALLRQAEAEKEVEKIVRLSQKEKSGEQEVHNAGRIKQSRPDGSKGDRKKCPEK